MTLVVFGLAGALLLSRATAGKPPPPPPPAPVKYTMTLVTLSPAAAMHTLEDVNNLGDFAGSVYTTEPGHVHAFVWWAPDYTSGTDLNTLLSQQQQDEGWELDFAFDINDQGQTTGIFHYRNGDPTDGVYRSHAFVYTPGQGIVALPGPWLYSRAEAINNRGEVTGAVSGIEPGVHVFVWNTRTNVVQVLDEGRRGLDMNDMGQVAYWAYNADGNPHAFRYTPAQDGNPARYEDLGVIGVLKDGTSESSASAINNLGEVVGQSTAYSLKGVDTRLAFRYTDGVGMVNLGAIDNAKVFPQSEACSINDARQVIGWSAYWDPRLGFRYRPFLYSDATGMINVWPLITNPPPGLTEHDMGLAVGTGTIINPARDFTFGRILVVLNSRIYFLTPDR
jgi:probable HAF family extracellular repeat protein